MPLTAEPEAGGDERRRLVLEGIAVEVPEAGGGRAAILSVDHLALEPGASVGLTGPSGAGKTTLLHVASGIIRPTLGRVLWGEDDVAAFSEPARDRWRRNAVGLVFQDFQLIPELDAFANVMLPATFTRFRSARALSRRARDLLDRVGLKETGRRTRVMSRGEQQRVAIARALLHGPKLILADEPTASLDQRNAETVAALLVEAASESGASLLVTSHDPTVLRRLGQVVRLEAGRLVGEEALA